LKSCAIFTAQSRTDFALKFVSAQLRTTTGFDTFPHKFSCVTLHLIATFMLYLKAIYCLMAGSKPHKIATMSNAENTTQLGSSPVVGTTLEFHQKGNFHWESPVFTVFFIHIAN